LSTTYTILCESEDKSVRLDIIDSLNPLPGSDTWECEDEEEWGLKSGSVASWASSDLQLYGLGAGPVATMFGFTKSVKKGDNGDGEKFLTDGNFPLGHFQWTCENID